MTDYSQPYLPPINHLTGGWGPWDQNISGTQPFSSQLGFDLYDNMGKGGDMDFWATPNKFSVSAAGNPDREQAAFAAWQRSPDWKLPGGFGGNANPLAPNVPGPFGTVNPMTSGPMYGGFGGGMLPPPSFGGGGSGGGGGLDIIKDVGDFSAGIREATKSIKDEFTPAIQGTVKMLTGGGGGFGLPTGPGISIGGNGSMGGFGGFLGDGSGWGGGGAGVIPGMATPAGGGQAAGMPSFGWSDFVSPQNGLNLNGLPLFRMRQASSLFIRPMMNRMEDYMSQTASQDLSMLQSGMMDYGELMQGQYGTIARRNIANEQFGYNLGKQVYNAYGGLAGSFLSGDAANGILGAGLAIGSPAIGAGMIGGAIGGMFGLGGPVGLLAGGATALLAAGSYAYNSSQDMMAVGRQQSAVSQMRESGQYNINGVFDNFSGVVGDYVGWWRNQLGSNTPEGSQRYNNAGKFYDVTQQYSQGGLSQDAAASMAQGYGYSRGELLTGAQANFYDNAGKLGMDRAQAGQFLSYWQRYNPRTMPSGQVAQDWQALTMAGVDLGSTSGSYADSLGIAGYDQGGMSLANGDISRYLFNLPRGANLGLASEGISTVASAFSRGNAARRAAGLSQFNALQFQGQTPDITNANAAFAEQSGSFALESPDFYNSVVAPTAAQRGYGVPGSNFNVGQFLRQSSIWQQQQNQFDRAAAYGADTSQLSAAMTGFSGLSPALQNIGNLIAGGDQLAISQAQLSGTLRDPRLRTLDPRTGLGAMVGGIDPSQYNMLQQDQGGLFRLSYSEAMGGTRGIEDQLRGLNRGMDLYQYNQATAARNIGYQMQTGGATGLSAQGFALGGDGLQGLSQLFAGQGMAFNAGNGMGSWQIEDAMTALNRQRQQFGYNQQGAQIALSNQQWNENWAMNMQQFQLSTAFQGSQMMFNRNQQVTQEGWQSEDLSMNRNRMELTYGWQQQDFDRSIRFARGRDRLDLMRQKERSTILHGLDETEADRGEERFNQQKEWSKEEFEAKKNYFEQSKQLQLDELNMQKRHHDEMQGLQQQARDKEKQWNTEQWKLEDQRRLLDRQNEQLQYKMETDMAVKVREVQEQSNKFNDALTAMGRQTETNHANLNILNSSMGVFDQWVKQVTSSIGSGTGVAAPTSTSTPAPYSSGQHVPGGGYAAGGYTGSGPSNQIAGVVHRNEYVVPEGGALVIRGGAGGGDYSAQMVSLLQQILMAMKNNMGGNMTVYTNMQADKTLYQKALSAVH